jgi:hypothetical protein
MSVPKFPLRGKGKIKSKKAFLPDLQNERVKPNQITSVWIDEAGEISERKPSVSLEGQVGKRVNRKKYDDLPNGHWEFEGDMRSGKAVGFIYVIKDLRNNMLYLGKKSYVGAGKLNKGVESNWRWYISSSKLLSESVKTNGKENFKFYAIEEYSFKGGLSFAETWSLCKVEALNENSRWYNGLIGKVSWKVKEPVTARHRRRLQQIIDGEI